MVLGAGEPALGLCLRRAEVHSTERTFEYDVGARCDQQKADRVVPGERLPEVEDREDGEHREREPRLLERRRSQLTLLLVGPVKKLPRRYDIDAITAGARRLRSEVADVDNGTS